MRTPLSLAVLTAAVLLTSCTTTGSDPGPTPNRLSFDSTQAAIAFRQDDRVRFANAAGRVWGDVAVKSPDWVWSTDGKHFRIAGRGPTARRRFSNWQGRVAAVPV